MRVVRLDYPADVEGWRRQARLLARGGVPPGEIVWQVGEADVGLFADDGSEVAVREGPELTVPRAFPDLAAQVVCHRDPERFGLLYRILLRLQGEPHLLKLAADADIHRAEAMAKAVRRDMHKMTAFVRFREAVDRYGQQAFLAWFEPDHHILHRVASFFVGRFTSMRWSILTPQGSLHWDGTTLRHGDGARKSDVPDHDRMEAYWRTYYASIFNPARLKSKAMKAEMPVKYWKNLPEAELIAPLIASAAGRMQAMVGKAPTEPPKRHVQQARRVEESAPPAAVDGAILSWQEAAAAARDCKRCALHCKATQTIFGEGPLDAPVIFVGEQPGDQEDLAGKPFVGPAGRMFDAALAEAGLDRSRAYVTNAVKHFKFQLRGKRRIHEKPNAGEVTACRFWIDLERLFIKPALVVAMGATALRSLTGHTGALAPMRGQDLVMDDGTALIATVHPSYLLRIPDEETRAREYARFVADLARVGSQAPDLRRRAAA